MLLLYCGTPNNRIHGPKEGMFYLCTSEANMRPLSLSRASHPVSQPENRTKQNKTKQS